jgi:hypothetical protein
MQHNSSNCHYTTMKDPFSLCNGHWLHDLVQPLAVRLGLPTLPLHIHEILFGIALYTFVYFPVSPILSRSLFPSHYPYLSPRSRINWDAHVVSLAQSSLISILALWVLWADDELRQMDHAERVWGYTGAAGLIQALVTGYFVWDLAMAILHFTVFGPGALAHAICALTVYVVGFRPFINYYSPIFILWELSTPFLNFHWFMDKIKLTGSKVQLYNGIALIGTFFCVRLVWGTYQSSRVLQDIWTSLNLSPVGSLDHAKAENGDLDIFRMSETMRYATKGTGVPIWAAVAVMVANMTLNSLNLYWFIKMIEAVKKRFPRSATAQKTQALDDQSQAFASVQGTAL